MLSLAPADVLYTVSDWVLDSFGPRSHEVAIYFTHALLAYSGDNRNLLVRLETGIPESVLTQIPQKFLNRGTPVTLRHFQMKFKLGQDIPESVWKVIEEQSFYESYEDYLPQIQQVEATRLSAGKDHGEQRLNRPRRQVTQALKSHPVTNYSSDLAPPLLAEPLTFSGKGSDGDQANERSDVESSMGIIDSEEDGLQRANQLALWIKHLANILHDEARQVSGVPYHPFKCAQELAVLIGHFNGLLAP